MFSQQHPFTLFENQTEKSVHELTHRLYAIPSLEQSFLAKPAICSENVSNKPQRNSRAKATEL